MSKPKQESPSIRWVFRCNYEGLSTEEWEISLEAERLFGELIEVSETFCYQLESAPTTGYLHFQGYFELKNKQRKTWLLRVLRPFEYLAKAKGTPLQAWSYACKEDTRLDGPWYFGSPRDHPNKQLQIKAFIEAVRVDNATNEHLWTTFPSEMTRYQTGLTAARSTLKPKRINDLEVYVFYGPPGTSKSRMARELFPDIYDVPPSKTFWVTPSAHGATHILFEDFDGQYPLKDFNRYIDRYPLEVPVKGGFVWWCPDLIIITTNTLPKNWYPGDSRQDVLGQIYRRITKCYDFTSYDWSQWTSSSIPPPGYSCEELSAKYPLIAPIFLDPKPRYRHSSDQPNQ